MRIVGRVVIALFAWFVLHALASVLGYAATALVCVGSRACRMSTSATFSFWLNLSFLVIIAVVWVALRVCRGMARDGVMVIWVRW